MRHIVAKFEPNPENLLNSDDNMAVDILNSKYVYS